LLYDSTDPLPHAFHGPLGARHRSWKFDAIGAGVLHEPRALSSAVVVSPVHTVCTRSRPPGPGDRRCDRGGGGHHPALVTTAKRRGGHRDRSDGSRYFPGTSSSNRFSAAPPLFTCHPRVVLNPVACLTWLDCIVADRMPGLVCVTMPYILGSPKGR